MLLRAISFIVLATAVVVARAQPAEQTPMLDFIPDLSDASHAKAAMEPQVPALVLPPSKEQQSAPPASASASASIPPPPVNLLSGTDSTLTDRESAHVALARRWIDGPRDASREQAAPGSNGALIFRYGGAMPSVVCAVGYICDIALQPGEIVNTVSIGDPVRWKVTPASSGAGANEVTHVVIKPSDIGLATNLLITTDRRTYALKLVSRRDDYMPSVAFSYPEDEAAAWAALAARREQHRAANVLPDTGQQVSELDFGYRLTGDKPVWRPVRVYSDGAKTYIQFPRAMQTAESPALVAIGADKAEQMVNYRVVGDRYVVDKVLDQALLLSGVGRKQVRVKIERRAES